MSEIRRDAASSRRAVTGDLPGWRRPRWCPRLDPQRRHSTYWVRVTRHPMLLPRVRHSSAALLERLPQGLVAVRLEPGPEAELAHVVTVQVRGDLALVVPLALPPGWCTRGHAHRDLSLIHISEPTRRT